jgi:hypothetical protein
MWPENRDDAKQHDSEIPLAHIYAEYSPVDKFYKGWVWPPGAKYGENATVPFHMQGARKCFLMHIPHLTPQDLSPDKMAIISSIAGTDAQRCCRLRAKTDAKRAEQRQINSPAYHWRRCVEEASEAAFAIEDEPAMTALAIGNEKEVLATAFAALPIENENEVIATAFAAPPIEDIEEEYEIVERPGTPTACTS